MEKVTSSRFSFPSVTDASSSSKATFTVRERKCAHRRPYAREQIADVLLQISFESAFPIIKFFRYLDTKTSVLRQTAPSLQHHGHLPHDAQAKFRYLQKMRVRKASDLLCTTDLSISSVAQECGFFDNSHLTSTFKSETGKTPSEFRKEVIINP